MKSKSPTSHMRGLRYQENDCLRIVWDVPPAPHGDCYPPVKAGSDNAGLNNGSKDDTPCTPHLVDGSLTVKSVLQCRKNHAQVLVVLAKDSEFGSPMELIAKVYDERLYDSDSDRESDCDSDDDNSNSASTPALAAYSREAAAYQALNDKAKAAHDKKYARAMGRAPKYYGSWAVDSVNDCSISAKPKVILLEYIKADSMENFYIDDEDKRKDIMQQLIEAESDLGYHAGVHHGDLLPRNVLVQENGDGYKVYIIDFDISRIGTRVDERYQNPLYWWVRSATVWSRQGWPDKNLDYTIDWMWEKFGNNSEYSPVRRDKHRDRFSVFPNLTS